MLTVSFLNLIDDQSVNFNHRRHNIETLCMISEAPSESMETRCCLRKHDSQIVIFCFFLPTSLTSPLLLPQFEDKGKSSLALASLEREEPGRSFSFFFSSRG